MTTEAQLGLSPGEETAPRVGTPIAIARSTGLHFVYLKLIGRSLLRSLLAASQVAFSEVLPIDPV